jgi:hypothetical protein
MRYLEHAPEHPRLEGELGLWFGPERERTDGELIRYQLGNGHDAGRRVRNTGATAYDLHARTDTPANKAKPWTGDPDIKEPEEFVTVDHDTSEVKIK